MIYFSQNVTWRTLSPGRNANEFLLFFSPSPASSSTQGENFHGFSDDDKDDDDDDDVEEDKQESPSGQLIYPRWLSWCLCI